VNTCKPRPGGLREYRDVPALKYSIAGIQQVDTGTGRLQRSWLSRARAFVKRLNITYFECQGSNPGVEFPNQPVLPICNMTPKNRFGVALLH